MLFSRRNEFSFKNKKVVDLPYTSALKTVLIIEEP